MDHSHVSTIGVELLGDLCAPVGSEPWCVAMAGTIARLLEDHQYSHEQLEQCLSDFREAQGWRKLLDGPPPKGKPFLFYEDFCQTRKPYGLGIDSDSIDAIVIQKPLDLLRRAWRKATPEERSAFLEYVNHGPDTP